MNLGFRHLVCWHWSRNVRMLMLKMQRKKFSTLGQTLTVPNHKKSSKATTYVPWCPSFLECFLYPLIFPTIVSFHSHTLFPFFFFLGRFCPHPLNQLILGLHCCFSLFALHFSSPWSFLIPFPPRAAELACWCYHSPYFSAHKGLWLVKKRMGTCNQVE